MASAPFAREAMQLAPQTPSLSVGVHLVLVDGRPCLPESQVRTLVGGDGSFYPTAGAFVRSWIASSVDPREVEHELRAQIETLCSTGARPTHLDSHKHVHMWPPVFAIVARLAREFGIPAVRLALERPVGAIALESRGDRRALKQSIDNALFVPAA